jgi:CheY-like chemotaxis protein
VPTTVNILLVEDDEVDIKAVRRAFRDLRICNPLTEAHDGIEALEHLRGTGGHAPIGHPCLVLLDLNMPRMSGLEFLNELRKDPELRSTSVFVMTTSAAEEDRIRAHDHNVAGYLLKDSSGRNFLEAISMLEHYWRIVMFPE